MRTCTPCFVTYCPSLKEVQGPKRVDSVWYSFKVKILLKISEVDVVVLANYDDDELDQLLRNIQLEKTEMNDGGNGNDGNLHVNSHAPLFEAVWSPTDETPNGKVGLEPDEGRDGERRQEGDPCQRPALLSPTNPADPAAFGPIFLQNGQVYSTERWPPDQYYTKKEEFIQPKAVSAGDCSYSLH